MESQKREKIKTCLHFHFPTRLASYPLTWYNDEKISARPWPGLRAGKGCGEVWEGEVQDGGTISQIQKHSHRVQMCPYTLWRCREATQRELCILASASLYSLS